MNFFLLNLVIMMLNCAVISAQDYKLLFSIPCNSTGFTTDPLSNLYLYSKGDIVKVNTDGIETARYSSREFGDISYVDATNPLKILVVFREFSKAVLLDAALSPHAIIDLAFPGIPFVTFICTSREEGFWIVDPVAKQLRKINEQLAIVADGTPFRQISPDEIEPSSLTDSGNWLIMNTTGSGLLIFDRFGTYYKSIPGIPEGHVQASGDDLLYKMRDGMMKTDIITGKSDHFILPPNESGDACRVAGNRIFVKSENSVKIYSY